MGSKKKDETQDPEVMLRTHLADAVAAATGVVKVERQMASMRNPDEPENDTRLREALDVLDAVTRVRDQAGALRRTERERT